MRWLVCILATLLAARAADAALVFQDRHIDPSGTETVYRFETDSEEIASTMDQATVRKIATSWAARYYKVQVPLVVEVQARTMPTRFWLIQLSAQGEGKREAFYAVVLPNGSIVEPTAARKPVAAAALIDRDSSGSSVDPLLTTPAKKIEIHGEISFTYCFGKGAGCAYRDLNPALNPARIFLPKDSDLSAICYLLFAGRDELFTRQR